MPATGNAAGGAPTTRQTKSISYVLCAGILCRIAAVVGEIGGTAEAGCGMSEANRTYSFRSSGRRRLIAAKNHDNNKTDPAFSSVVKIAKALGVSLTDLFKADELFNDVNSFDKSLMEKMALVEQLDKKEKTAFYAVLDAFFGKKKMKDALSNILTDV